MRVICPVESLLDDVLLAGNMANKRRKTSGNSSNKKKSSNSPSSVSASDELVPDAASEFTSVSKCTHVKSAVNANRLRKKIQSVKDFRCEHCPKDAGSGVDGDGDYSEDVWCCMNCGHLGCGRSSNNKHALKHFEQPHSDSHCIVLNLRTFGLWCYSCDDAVAPDAAPVLKDLIKFISQRATRRTGQSMALEHTVAEHNDKKPSSIVGADEFTTNTGKRNKAEITSPEIKGLSNLGNTCFFNAVMQTMAQTHVLQFVLNDKDTFLKGGKVVLEPAGAAANEIRSLSPVEIRLGSDPGDLASALCSFLAEFRQNSSKIMNPSALFGQVCKKAPRFKGYQQQDSHELLRYMLDALRAEETMRLRRAVTQYFGIDLEDRAKIASLDVKTRNKIKAYDAKYHRTFVEEVFGGQLLQTIKCLTCHHVSERYEQFLDLSLPIVDAKVTPQVADVRKDVNERPKALEKKENESTKQLSKHQQKKANKSSRKAAKAAGRRRTSSTKDSESGIQESEAKDDLETSKKDLETSKMDLETSKMDLETSKDDLETSKSDLETSRDALETCKDNMDGLSAAFENSLSLEEDGLNDTLNDVNECSIDRSSETVVGDDSSPNQDENGIEDEQWDKENEHSPMNGIATISNVEPLNMDDDYSYSTKCTLAGCLRNFTAVELLSGKNKFGCANCAKANGNTKIRNSENGMDCNEETAHGKEKRNRKDSNPVVYTDAEKRYLVYSPPAVLTMHLKRFQQVGYGMRKMNKHVEFPLLLDISPYCCKNGKGYSSTQKRVLYSLYGIVCHSGGMSGGHYVAYVKLRPKNERLVAFLRRGNHQHNGNNNICMNGHVSNYDHSPQETYTGNGLAENGNGSDGEFTTSKSQGTWYYVSDTQVNEVSESRALAAEAYLLFYERIY